MLRIALISAAVIAVAAGAPVPEHDVPGQYAYNYNSAIQAADTGAERVRRRLPVFTAAEEEKEEYSVNAADDDVATSTYALLNDDLNNDRKDGNQGVTDVNLNNNNSPTRQSRFAHIATEPLPTLGSNGGYESSIRDRERNTASGLPNGYTRLTLRSLFRADAVYDPLPQLKRFVGENYASRLLHNFNPMLMTVLKDVNMLAAFKGDLFDMNLQKKWRMSLVKKYFRLKAYVEEWEENVVSCGVKVEKGKMWEVIDPWKEIQFS